MHGPFLGGIRDYVPEERESAFLDSRGENSVDSVMSSVEELFQAARQLPEEQQLTLIERLLAAHEPPASKAAQTAWDREIQRRIKDYDEGKTSSRPATEVFSELDSRLGE